MSPGLIFSDVPVHALILVLTITFFGAPTVITSICPLMLAGEITGTWTLPLLCAEWRRGKV
jgi:hypothetical protein